MTFRLGYLVSGGGGLLQATLNAVELGLLPLQVGGVVADRECGAAERARAAGVPSRVVPFRKFAERSDFDRALLDAVAELEVDGLVLNFDRLVRADLIDAYRNRMINLHFSLLPLFPGFRAIEAACASGMRFAGVSAHLVDEQADTGPILAQAVLPVAPEEPTERVGRRLFELAVPLQLQSLSFLAEGRIRLDEAGRARVRAADYSSLPFSPALEAGLKQLPAAVLAGIDPPEAALAPEIAPADPAPGR